MAVTRYAQPMSPRMPYQSVSNEKGASVMMRWPFAPRKANASQISAASPISRTQKLTVFHTFHLGSRAEGRGEIEQKAAMAERYINTHHQSPDQPSAGVSGVS